MEAVTMAAVTTAAATAAAAAVTIITTTTTSPPASACTDAAAPARAAGEKVSTQRSRRTAESAERISSPQRPLRLLCDLCVETFFDACGAPQLFGQGPT